MSYPIALLGHPVLRMEPRAVDRAELIRSKPDEPTRMERIVDQMVETMLEVGGIGLAAPQVAMRLRLVLVAPPGKRCTVLFNPRITERSSSTSIEREGCLSIPGIGLRVERACEVEVEAMDPQGNLLTFDAEGDEARIVQHELDHLAGRLICDCCVDDDRQTFKHWYRTVALHLPNDLRSSELVQLAGAAR